MYPILYIWYMTSGSFHKRKYSDPVMNKHGNDVLKDWYVFFKFKYEGKIYKYKRREGVNRIKSLNERLIAIEKLLQEIQYDLKHGWNPILDPKRETNYNPYMNRKEAIKNKKDQPFNIRKRNKTEIFDHYFNKQ
ncbi:MAG TPA: hypothetical protein VFN30_14625 [Chitinophagaceae bacterium]|nr:hypothetical protein [Chitinophagaceae bacterium]